MRKQLLLLATLSLLTTAAVAQTRYVSDELRINLRSGAGDQYRIAEILPSGTRLTLLEESDGEWLHVRTPAGDEGWVREQYVQEGRIAQDLLEEAQERVAELSEQQEELSGESGNLRQENQRLTQELEAARTETENLSAELEELQRVSSNAVELNETNQELVEERQLLQTEIDVLQAENERLRDDARQTWFLYGAIAVGIGIIMTLIAQGLRGRRRYSEWA